MSAATATVSDLIQADVLTAPVTVGTFPADDEHEPVISCAVFDGHERIGIEVFERFQQAAEGDHRVVAPESEFRVTFESGGPMTATLFEDHGVHAQILRADYQRRQ